MPPRTRKTNTTEETESPVKKINQTPDEMADEIFGKQPAAETGRMSAAEPNEASAPQTEEKPRAPWVAPPAEEPTTAIGKIVSFSYTKTVQKHGKFEPDKLEINYQLAPGEDIEEAYDEVKQMALYLLNKED